MDYIYHKRYFPEDVLVYIEEGNKTDILFDFIDSNEMESFSRYSNTSNDLNKPSMVLLKNYKSKKISENTIYAISRETIEDWKREGRINNERLDSFLIGFIIELNETNTAIFKSSVSIRFIGPEYSTFFMFTKTDIRELQKTIKGPLNVVVRNVGQGNWNEIYSENVCKYVYDAGAPMLSSRNNVRIIIGNKPQEYEKSKPILFLSHWDKDHYHSLLGMTDDELKCFSCFICRNKVPNRTSRLLYNRIINSVGINNVFAIPAEQRNARGGPTYLIPITPTNNQLVIYNSQEHKNRNISGIVLTLKTKKSSIVFSGDSHYIQISRDVLPHLNYKHIHNLIVPHHGGKAGDFFYNLPYGVKQGISAVSVGINNYGHPNRAYIRALTLEWFNVRQTEILNNDIEINL